MSNKTKIAKRKLHKGFTLIELLTAIGIFGVIGTIAVSVIFITFRGTKKSETITIVKQNGDYALTQIVKSIRYAKSLDSPVSCVPAAFPTSIIITSSYDDGQTTYSCPAGASTTLSSNSASLIDTQAVTISGCSFTCSQKTSADPPTINIKFTLTANSATGFIENTASIPFESSVTMRNFFPN